MEYLLFGSLIIAMVIGSLAGFFSMFSKRSQQDKLRQLETDITHLKTRLQSLELTTNTNRDVTTEQIVKTADHMVAPLSNQHDNSQSIQPSEDVAVPINTQEDQVISDNVDHTETRSTSTSVEGDALETTLPNARPLPNLLKRGFNYAKNWLFNGNTLVRSGVVILFIGIAFLVKFAADNQLFVIPIELRLAAVALFGTGLIFIGWRLRHSRTDYAWALQGGGIGILYLTIFAAMRLYQLIPASIAFTLLTVIALLSAAIAVLQSALPLAVLGFAGGFLAPIFTSDGSGSHVGLFSYYLVLNLAIAVIAYYKSWRALNLLGFAFTFIIGTLWGARNYQPEYFSTTEPFLIIHFLLFTLIAVLYAFRQSTKANDYVDATLVFGTPLVAFSLQYALLRDSHFGLAYSALALATLYLGLVWWIFSQKRNTHQFLGECFLALGIGFATLTLPLALDGRWTSAAWAIEGVGLLWIGLKQNRRLPVWSGLALQLLGAAAFAYGWGLTSYDEINQQNLFLGIGFIALASWACGALYDHYRPNQAKLLTWLLALWGWAWWMGAGMTAIDQWLANQYLIHASLIFFTISSLLLPVLAERLQWAKLGQLCVLLLPVMFYMLVLEIFESHPFANIGAFSWLLAFGGYIALMYHEKIPSSAKLRAPLLWIIAIIGSMEWQYQFSHIVNAHSAWQNIGWAIVPILLVSTISLWEVNGRQTLNERHKLDPFTWGWLACAPLMAFIIVWFLWMSLNSDGNAAPLSYIPLLNPLDIALCGSLLLLLIWQRRIAQHFSELVSKYTHLLAGIMAFTLLNGMLLRTLHHWTGTPFQWTAIFDYPTVQLAFTFLWAITAFILMLLAHRGAQRPLWMIGAALMVLVVAKIFLLDLAQHGTVERIVSFIGAGVMLLIMGYFAPLPPTKIETKAA